MSKQLVSTIGTFEFAQADKEPITVSRELVFDQDLDGSWLVYVAHPDTVDDAGEDMVSSSIHVKDPQQVELISDIVAILIDPEQCSGQRGH